MKKLILLLTVSVAAVSLVACSQSSNPSSVADSVDKYLTDDIQANIGAEVEVTVTPVEKVTEIPGFHFLQIDIQFQDSMAMPADTFYIISDGKYIIPDVISFSNPQETLLTSYINKNANNAAGNTANLNAPLMADFDYSALTLIYGDAEAPTKIVVASDFQCPFCEQLHSQLMPLLAGGNYNVAVYSLEFPLDSIHPKARLLSQIHIASSMEGNTLLTDAIFQYAMQNGEALSGFADADILNYFAGMTSNPTNFIALATSQKVMDMVSANQNFGLSIGINSTPTVFVNGQQIDLGSASIQDILISAIAAQ